MTHTHHGRPKRILDDHADNPAWLLAKPTYFHLSQVDRSDLASERIREAAYRIWQHSGGTHGHDVDDWLQAEREFYQPPSGDQ
jgi:hypothetical protein